MLGVEFRVLAHATHTFNHFATMSTHLMLVDLSFLFGFITIVSYAPFQSRYLVFDVQAMRNQEYALFGRQSKNKDTLSSPCEISTAGHFSPADCTLSMEFGICKCQILF